jgi:phage baseplate assembly protein W
MSIYRGFSTISSLSQKKFVLTDAALIKQDLLNVLKTRRGSRVMQPSFGCIVWEKLFETISQTDVEDISNNITSIINNDPRVNLISLDVNPSGNSITVTLILQYAGTNQTEQMQVIFNNELDTSF